MNKLLIITILVTMSLGAHCQKIVIGGKVPEIKGDKVEWLTPTPTKGRAVLYDFYSSTNPSSVKDYALLSDIYNAFVGKLDIVLISPKDDVGFRAKFKLDGEKYYFGVNVDNSIFTSFGVQYLPFYMLVNGKGDMVWQGSISNLTISKISAML